MMNPSESADRLGRALSDPSGGVVGLVDELLAVSCQQDLHLDWQAGRCHVKFSNAPTISVEAPLQKSVMRAALARVAVLCNERNPNSVSPHGGQSELAIGSDAAKAVRVQFVNTPETQSLDLVSIQPEAIGPTHGQSLAAIHPAVNRMDRVENQF